MIANKRKELDVERKLEEFETRLRKRLDLDRRIKESFETGAMPQIHVSVEALAGTAPRGA